MKTLILELGEIVLNILIVLGVINAFLGSIAFFQFQKILFPNLVTLLPTIFSIILTLLGVIMSAFVVYLLIDIRDKIAENNQLLKDKN